MIFCFVFFVKKKNVAFFVCCFFFFFFFVGLYFFKKIPSVLFFVFVCCLNDLQLIGSCRLGIAEQDREKFLEDYTLSPGHFSLEW